MKTNPQGVAKGITPGLQLDMFSHLLPAPGEVLTVLSYGIGQDSSAILYKFGFDAEFRRKYAPGRLLVVTAATGDEHPHTNQYLWHVKAFCKKHDIKFVHIIPDMGYHSPSWQSLRGFYRLKCCVGSKAFPKTCTDRLKLQPIYRFLEDWIGKEFGVASGKKKGFRNFAGMYGKIRMLVGISRGEEKRVASSMEIPRWKRDSIETVYPLIEEGMDRKDCQDYIRSVGQPVPWPSNCMLCPFLSEIELVWLYRRYQLDYEEWVEIEAAKLEKNRHMGERNLGVWGTKKLPEVLERALAKHGHMTDAELDEYKFSHGCVMSKY